MSNESIPVTPVSGHIGDAPNAGAQKLMSKDALLRALFEDDSRPSPRTFEAWKRRRVIPYVKIGRMCFYDVAAVRAALDKHFTIKSKWESKNE